MSRTFLTLSATVLGVLFSLGSAASQETKTSEPDWSVTMTVIDACSCPVFCQCFFAGKPPAQGGHAGHESGGAKHFCRFNQAYRVDAGHFGMIRLDGAKFWFAGDAGEDFALPKLDWAILTFDSSVTKEQSDALVMILRNLRFYQYERWNSYKIAKSAPIRWATTPDGAEASLDGGKTAEVVLRRLKGMNDGPVTLHNLKYFGYPRNNGLVLMPNEVEAYRVGERAFEFRGSHGLLTTVEITSKDIKK